MQKRTKIIASLLFLATLASLIAINTAFADDSGLETIDNQDLTFTPAPLSASAFSNVTIMTGQTWYFFAESAGGVGAVSFQWYQGTTMLSGQTDMVLATTQAAAGTYTYTCQVRDDAGTVVTTNPITLTVR
jgi:hypothetical protein